MVDAGGRPRHDGGADRDRDGGHGCHACIPQARLTDRALEGARRLLGAVHADDDALDGRELLARGVARDDDNGTLRVRGEGRGDGTEQAISESTATAGTDDDHVDLGGEVDEHARRVSRFGRAGHMRGAALARHGLRFLDDLLSPGFQGLVVKHGVTAIQGGG